MELALLQFFKKFCVIDFDKVHAFREGHKKFDLRFDGLLHKVKFKVKTWAFSVAFLDHINFGKYWLE